MITNDFRMATDVQMYPVLLLLDLSAAFDTVNNSILSDRLRNWVGISGKALQWFSSYMLNSRVHVSIRNYMSSFTPVKYSV